MRLRGTSLVVDREPRGRVLRLHQQAEHCLECCNRCANLLMELDDHDRRESFLIHDRDTSFPRSFDASSRARRSRSSVPVGAGNSDLDFCVNGRVSVVGGG
jgi:hypothetical protein